jgi:hypothetical protein
MPLIRPDENAKYDERVAYYKSVYLHSLITMHALLGINDRLIETDAYKQKVKSTGNVLIGELRRNIDADLGDIWGKQGATRAERDRFDKILYHCMNQQEQFVDNVANLDISDYEDANRAIALLLAAPEQMRLLMAQLTVELAEGQTKLIEQ